MHNPLIFFLSANGKQQCSSVANPKSEKYVILQASFHFCEIYLKEKQSLCLKK